MSDKGVDGRDVPAGCRLVVGLGNPGSRYATTRHNAGYRVVERLRVSHGTAGPERSEGLEYWIARTGETVVFLARPLSFMNESGPPVAELLARIGGEPETCLVVHDDIDIALGSLRFRRGGSSGGHRGIESLIESLGTDTFSRLKVGVGRPGETDSEVVDFVLSAPPVPEATVLGAAEAVAADAAWRWVTDGLDVCMNLFNRRIAGAEESKP